MRESLIAVTIAGATTLGLCAPGMAQENADQRLGTVHFATSCNETAQRRFDRAMRYQHSFWYTESKEIYEETLKADPECAIAYWGIALSLLNNPHGPVPAPNLPLGLAAIERVSILAVPVHVDREHAVTILGEAPRAFAGRAVSANIGSCRHERRGRSQTTDSPGARRLPPRVRLQAPP